MGLAGLSYALTKGLTGRSCALIGTFSDCLIYRAITYLPSHKDTVERCIRLRIRRPA